MKAFNINEDAAPGCPTAYAVFELYKSIRRDIEEPDGSWNGGDVVETLCEWFVRHGFNVDGPNPFADRED